MILGFLTPAAKVKAKSSPNDPTNAWFSSTPIALSASLTPPAKPLIFAAVLPNGAPIPNHSAGVDKTSPAFVSYSFVGSPSDSYTAL